eukprot:1140786-Pelagomonas_calceolata.AAC.1
MARCEGAAPLLGCPLRAPINTAHHFWYIGVVWACGSGKDDLLVFLGQRKAWRGTHLILPAGPTWHAHIK